MKKTVLIIFLCILLSACGVGKASSTAEVTANTSKDIVVIDIATWQHPVKEVLEKHGIRLYWLELTQNKTYPTFFIEFPPEITDIYYPKKILDEVSYANVYWDYTFIDEKRNLKINVKNDKDRMFVKSYTYNSIIVEVQDFGMVQPEYIKYAKFLNQNKKVVKFIKEDIDLDGIEEVAISFGKYDDPYVLKADGDKLTYIGRITGNGYAVEKVSFIKMQSSNKKYIAAIITNTANLYGFALYEVNAGKLSRIEASASATGAGNDVLTSTNNDAVFDGYKQNRCSYDVMYFNTYRYYAWNGQGFNHIKTVVDTKEYPLKPEDVAEQYVRLNMLFGEDKQSLNVITRLKEINIGNKQLDYKRIDDVTNGMISVILFAKNQFNTKVSDDVAEVSMQIKNSSIVFILIYNNDKWQITDIQGDFVINKS
jgi:hypothetical protein